MAVIELDAERERLRDVARETNEITSRVASLPPLIDKLTTTQQTAIADKARDGIHLTRNCSLTWHV